VTTRRVHLGASSASGRSRGAISRVFGLDLVLLHAPSVWDFREEVILQGPLADVIPSTTQFEMYPIGMTSIAAYLEANNYNVRMVNLAYRMLRKPGYDVPARIDSLDAAVFGIDLHWLPHANGALGVAELAATRRHGRRQPADVRPRGPGLDRRARVRLHGCTRCSSTAASATSCVPGVAALPVDDAAELAGV
jgi:hypothetical protein